MREPIRFPPSPRAEIGSVRVARLAARQWGVVTRRQLEACGVGGSTISRWLAAGRLHRLHSGVYAVGHPAVGLQGRLAAALLAAGRGAALSHGTAAWWWQVVRREPERIHVSRVTVGSAPEGTVLHRPRTLERAWHRGFPFTPVPRTLLDIAATATCADLRRALAEAEYRGLVRLEEVEAELGRGHPGSAALREALARHRPELARTLSVLEERFLALCEGHRLPIPEVNAMIQGLMVDALWRLQRVVVELDGHAAHGSRSAMERDRQRELVLRSSGHVVLRYTWRQVSRSPHHVAADLRAALGLPR
jgi:very-short-patch-repair endonuclease